MADSDIGTVRNLANIDPDLLQVADGVVGQVTRQLGGELLLPRMSPNRTYSYFGNNVFTDVALLL